MVDFLKYELAGHKIHISGEMESSIHSGLPLEYIEKIQVVKKAGETFRGIAKIRYGKVLYQANK
jgi:hypothetical protein